MFYTSAHLGAVRIKNGRQVLSFVGKKYAGIAKEEMIKLAEAAVPKLRHQPREAVKAWLHTKLNDLL